MPKLVSKCGIDCGSCPWGPYTRKNMTAIEFEQYRVHSKQVLGYMPIKTPCVTCQTPDAEIPKGSKLPNRKCLIRQCVDKSGMANCAYCSRFPCDTLKATAGVWNRKAIEEKLGAPLSENDYQAFVEPFEGLSRLEAIHASAKPEEIVEPAKVLTVETLITDFPETLRFSREEKTSFRAVYDLLTSLERSSLGMRDADTFAQHNKLENLRAAVLRFLWILGNYGKFDKETGIHLVVHAGVYLANRGSEKSLAIWSFVRDNVFKALYKFGVRCERVALNGFKEEDLATGTGYLRSKGWIMKMSFEEKIGGANTLKALQTYVRELDGKYGKKALAHLRGAGMSVFLEK